MTKNFEIGAYYQNLKEIDVSKTDHVTVLESEPNEIEAFQKKHPHLKLSLARSEERRVGKECRL